jgi:RNA recognition motif-containing protein
MIVIEDPYKFDEIAYKLRYFTFKGKHCRALPKLPELFDRKTENLHKQTVFVKQIPKEVMSDGLETYFKKFGGIVTA